MGAARRAPVEVLVRFPGQKEAATQPVPSMVRFETDRPLEEQLEGLCSIRGVPFNQDEHHQVLLCRGSEVGNIGSVVLGCLRSFHALPGGRVSCDLRSGVEVVNSQLQKIEAAGLEPAGAQRNAALRSALGVLLRSARGSSWFSEEVIAQDGIQVLFDALVLSAPDDEVYQEKLAVTVPGEPKPLEACSIAVNAADDVPEGPSASELAASCLGELLQYENGVAWCEQCSEQVFLGNAEVFDALLRGALRDDEGSGSTTPQAFLRLSLFLLATQPNSSIQGVHMAATKSGDHLYRQLVEACLERYAAWRSTAATALVAAILEVAEEVSHLKGAVQVAFLRAADNEDARDFVEELLQKNVLARRACWVQQLLADSLAAGSQAACGALETEAANCYAKALGLRLEASTAEEPRRVLMLENRIRRLEEELRRTHLAMRKMSRLADVGEHSFLQENLEVVVRTGWDSVLWEQGYTALHYAAEAVESQDVVEMLCHLATNLQSPDYEGLSPAERARRVGRDEVAQLIDSVQLEREERANGLRRQEALALQRHQLQFDALPGEPPEAPAATDRQGGLTQAGTWPRSPVSSGSARRSRSVAFSSDQHESALPPAPVIRRLPSLNSGNFTESPHMKHMAHQLRGQLYVAQGGSGFIARAQPRYFAMMAVQGVPGELTAHYELGFWENQDAFLNGGIANGSINASTITEITGGGRGIAEAVFAIRYQEGANLKELVVVAKDARGIPSNTAAQRWITDLRNFRQALRDGASPIQHSSAQPRTLGRRSSRQLAPPAATLANPKAAITASSTSGTATSAAPVPKAGQPELLAAATSRTLAPDEARLGSLLGVGEAGTRTSRQRARSATNHRVTARSSRRLLDGEPNNTENKGPQRKRRGTLPAPRGSQAHVRVFARTSPVADLATPRLTAFGQRALLLHRSATEGETFSMATGSSDEGYESDPGPTQNGPKIFRISSQCRIEPHHLVRTGTASSNTKVGEEEVQPLSTTAHVLYEETSWTMDAQTPIRRDSGYSSACAAERLYDKEWCADTCRQASGTGGPKYSPDSEILYEDESWLNITPVRRIFDAAHSPPPAFERSFSDNSEDGNLTTRKQTTLQRAGAARSDNNGLPQLSRRPSMIDSSTDTRGPVRETEEDAAHVPAVSSQQGNLDHRQPRPKHLEAETQTTSFEERPSDAMEQNSGDATPKPVAATGVKGKTPPTVKGKGKTGDGGRSGKTGTPIETITLVSETPASTTPVKAPASTTPAKGPSKGKGKPPGKGAAPTPPLPSPSGEKTEEVPKQMEMQEMAPSNAKGKGPGKGPTGPSKGPTKGEGAAGPSKGPTKGAGPAKGAGPGGPGAKAGGKAGKGRGKEDPGLQKPAIQPTRPMKSLWWTRFVFGQHLKEGSSVWDKVPDATTVLPKDTFEERFAKATRETKRKCSESNQDKKTSQNLKELRIITDTNLIVGKEGALRDFPPAETVAQALKELDESVLNPQRLAILKTHFCPQPAEVTQLEELRKNNPPEVPWGAPERYMYAVSRVPAFRARVECWAFLCSFEERAAGLAQGLNEFQRVEETLLKSQELPRLLSLVLAAGNYLNGGTGRGRADGFDLETLGKLDGVKDNAAEGGARDMRHFIFEMFFLGAPRDSQSSSARPEAVPQSRPDGASLLEDLAPLLRNVNRTLTRDSEGVLKVTKNVRVVLEDLEESVRELSTQFGSQQEALLQCLQCCEDPADPMRLQMSERFAEARPQMSRLEVNCNKCRENFTQILSYFNHPGMKTSDFLLLWDNLFVPGDLILNKPEALRKREILPVFCKPQAVPSVESFLVLWDLRVLAEASASTPSADAATGDTNSGSTASATTARRGRLARRNTMTPATARHGQMGRSRALARSTTEAGGSLDGRTASPSGCPASCAADEAADLLAVEVVAQGEAIMTGF